jgi:hypothetical protein
VTLRRLHSTCAARVAPERRTIASRLPRDLSCDHQGEGVLAKIAIGSASRVATVILTDDLYARVARDGGIVLSPGLQYRLQAAVWTFERASRLSKTHPRANEVEDCLTTVLAKLEEAEKALERLKNARDMPSAAAYVMLYMNSFGCQSPGELHASLSLSRASVQKTLHQLPNAIYGNQRGREGNLFLREFIAELASIYKEAGGRPAGRNSRFTAFVWALRDALPRWLKLEKAASRDALGERIRRELRLAANKNRRSTSPNLSPVR